MKRVERSREVLKYTIDFQHPPVLEVELGESFALETEDACSGYYRTQEDAARLLDAWYLNYSPSKANPVTGPVYIRGVEPGDTLIVHLEGVELDTQGATYWRPGHKPLGDSLAWGDLSKPTLVIGRIEKNEVVMDAAATWEDGKVVTHSLGLRVRQSPFVGTIAVAPEREVETPGLGQGSWGGNMDVHDICPGNRVLLPCFTRVLCSMSATCMPVKATPNFTELQWKPEVRSHCTARSSKANRCLLYVWTRIPALSRWRAHVHWKRPSRGRAFN